MRRPSNTIPEIRVLQPDEISLARDLLNLFADAFDEPETYSASQPSDAYLAENIASGRFLLVVALLDSRVVGGFGAFELTKFEQERRELFVYDLAVHSEYRRQGIATSLLEAAKDIARSRGIYLVWIQSEADDTRASSVYHQFAEPLAANSYEFSPHAARRKRTPTRQPS